MFRSSGFSVIRMIWFSGLLPRMDDACTVATVLSSVLLVLRYMLDRFDTRVFSDRICGRRHTHASDRSTGRVVSMRVIAGRFKGMALATPKPGTRPTTDRTKEAVFSHLDSWDLVRGANVLDLFAGTGALGIEALSRGARSLVAVESAGPAAALINGTFAQLKRSKAWRPELSARVMRRRAEVFVDSYHGAPFDLVFIDPPYAYATEECNTLLDALAQGATTGPDTMIVVERSVRSDALTSPAGWHEADARTYGETAVIYLEPSAKTEP